MLEIAIKELLEEITGLDVFPTFGTCKPPFLTYIHTPIGGGVVKESQIEIKIISDDFDYCLEIKKAINNAFDMEENIKAYKKDNIAFRSSLSGGGQLFNDSIQTWEISLIYIVNWRCLNE